MLQVHILHASILNMIRFLRYVGNRPHVLLGLTEKSIVSILHGKPIGVYLDSLLRRRVFVGIYYNKTDEEVFKEFTVGAPLETRPVDVMYRDIRQGNETRFGVFIPLGPDNINALQSEQQIVVPISRHLMEAGDLILIYGKDEAEILVSLQPFMRAGTPVKRKHTRG